MSALPTFATDAAIWTAVCALDDILPDMGVAALVEGRQLALFRIAGRGTDADAIYALDNHDPMSGANVLSRGIVGDVGGVLVVASPIYKHHYALDDGRCLEDAAVRVAAHAARIVDGRVEVSLAP